MSFSALIGVDGFRVCQDADKTVDASRGLAFERGNLPGQQACFFPGTLPGTTFSDTGKRPVLSTRGRRHLCPSLPFSGDRQLLPVFADADFPPPQVDSLSPSAALPLPLRHDGHPTQFWVLARPSPLFRPDRPIPKIPASRRCVLLSRDFRVLLRRSSSAVVVVVFFPFRDIRICAVFFLYIVHPSSPFGF